MRYLLDNILLTHETMDWANHTGQLLLFLKLDFSKAYDMVNLGFLSSAMMALDFPEEFISMTMLLFQNTKATVKVNGAQSPSFSI